MFHSCFIHVVFSQNIFFFTRDIDHRTQNMGKNTDKLYITQSEWQQGGHSIGGGAVKSSGQEKSDSKSPFWTCSISQQPINDGSGVVDKHGHVFDLQNLFPYIRKNKENPVTGEPMTTKDVKRLKISKNGDGDYADPVSLKPFQRLSEVVVIWTTGNVYFKDTIKENNIKPKVWRDLVDEVEFKQSDIIKLTGGVGIGTKRTSTVKHHEPHEQPKKKRKIDNELENSKPKSSLTTHHVASSLTSTAVEPTTETQYKDVDIQKLLKQKKYNKPGYATIETSLGKLNVELDARYSPKAVYNFVKLAQKGYYNGIIFHRNIKHFMAQTGDPTGTGTGGESIFGQKFADETNTPKKHDSRGVLSMANSGKNTNGSQFFITYRPASHLDGKHTVFGKVVGGMDTLDKIERVPVDKNDRPKETVMMKTVTVLVDPFEEAAPKEDTDDTVQNDNKPFLKPEDDGQQAAGPVGKYLTNTPKFDKPSTAQPKKKVAVKSIKNSDFSAW